MQDGRIDYGEFVAMMQKGNAGIGRRTMRNSLNLSMRDGPGALQLLNCVLVQVLIVYQYLFLNSITQADDHQEFLIIETYERTIRHTMTWNSAGCTADIELGN